MLLRSAQELPSFTLSLTSNPTPIPNRSKAFTFPKPSALALLRHRHRHLLLRTISIVHPSPYLSLSVTNPRRWGHLLTLSNSSDSSTTLIEQLAGGQDGEPGYNENLDFSRDRESEMLDFDGSFASTDLRHFKSPSLEVIELEELPEQWRRSKLAWLCKELPAHKSKTMFRVLNAQRKWIRQEDATYILVHCMRIRENEAAFRVYKWMIQQQWFQFDFALATKLADYLGKERKYLKCREIFNDIINQGRVPSESTFHILIIAYLSSSARGCLEEACSVYNRMIQLGGYKPRLSLHNALFRALVSKPGGSSKHYLRQAEFVFHNLVTSGLDIHKDIYGGLIWLHSYQDVIDKGRIASLRAEMEFAGIEEGKEVLVSILRACSKEGDLEEAETTWIKLLESGCSLPSHAYVHRLEVYAKVGDPLKSLEIFREMQQQLDYTSVVAYHKIIEILCKAQRMELAQQLMTEFMASDMKPLMPSFIELMNMYLKSGLHDKLEETFFQCLEKCSPNRTIYTLYLESLVQNEHLDKAEEIFHQMYSDGSIGVNTHSCNTILGGYLSCDECVKAEKIYDLMCQKKFNIESSLKEKLDHVLSLRSTTVKKPISLVLSKEQREILIGLLLGGLQIESDEERRNHAVRFEFDENDRTHSVLKKHLFDLYLEWLASFCRPTDDSENIPCHLTTISHSYYKFYADQFRPNGQPVIPKLIHRWLSPRVLAYWYMYGGYKTSSGDFLLKVMASQEGIKKIVKVLKTKSLDCRVKRKGKVFWIGFLGSNATLFWTLIEPFIIYDLKDSLIAGGQSLKGVLTQDITFDSRSESDEKAYDYSEDDIL